MRALDKGRRNRRLKTAEHKTLAGLNGYLIQLRDLFPHHCSLQRHLMDVMRFEFEATIHECDKLSS